MNELLNSHYRGNVAHLDFTSIRQAAGFDLEVLRLEEDTIVTIIDQYRTLASASTDLAEEAPMLLRTLNGMRPLKHEN